jgi:glycosyltransferase involved in cell wall biosynthesis
MKLCAVIPAFNNEPTISEVVQKTRVEIDHVVVVDDGSTDNTAQLAEAAGAHLLRVPKNRGKGNALRVAFRYAVENDLDAVITLDADLQHDPSEIPSLLKHYVTHRSRVVIGNRLTDRENIPRIRYTVNRIGAYTFSWLINQPVEDSQCGFRLYDRQVIGNFQILNDGFEAEADLLLRAGKRGYKIGFVPIKTIYFPDRMSRSYYRPVKDTFRISIIFLMNLFWKNR